jgi:hypothetical protein
MPPVRLRIAAVAALLTTLALAGGATPNASSRAHFEHERIRVATAKIFDLGVADYDDDGRLDIFTNNHKFEQSLLRNHGGFGFADRLAKTRLSSTPAFPGVEDIFDPPRNRSRRGLYIYMRGVPGADFEGAAQLKVLSSDPARPASGTLRFNLTPEVTHRSGAKLEIHHASPGHWNVAFKIDGRGSFAVKPRFPATPYGVALDHYPLGRVFVGHRRINPRSHAFRITLRDRHGTAWTDLDRDGDTDAFWVVGGFKGQLGHHLGIAQDQEMLQRHGAFAADDDAGLVKGACGGRQAEAVDYDADGLVDLFEGCIGSRPKLYRQQRSGGFADVSAELDAAVHRGNHYRWADIDRDGRPDLVAAIGHHVTVYGYRGRRWRQVDRAALRGRPADGSALAIADGDRDGDVDVFIASEQGNTLLVNRRGGLRSLNPGRRGLPSAGSDAAAWVDYDNDGRLDLYTVPQGLSRARGGGFVATRMLTGASGANYAIVAWPDLDRNGGRDLLRLAPGTGGRTLTALRRRGHGGHWLELNLHGRAGNRDAIGARATVRAGRLRQTQWVGQNETSRFSQGHYRLYFGLGGRSRARIRVRWPDGSVQRLGRTRVNRVLTVAQQ